MIFRNVSIKATRADFISLSNMFKRLDMHYTFEETIENLSNLDKEYIFINITERNSGTTCSISLTKDQLFKHRLNYKDVYSILNSLLPRVLCVDKDTGKVLLLSENDCFMLGNKLIKFPDDTKLISFVMNQTKEYVYINGDNQFRNMKDEPLKISLELMNEISKNAIWDESTDLTVEEPEPAQKEDKQKYRQINFDDIFGGPLKEILKEFGRPMTDESSETVQKRKIETKFGDIICLINEHKELVDLAKILLKK